MRLKNRKKSAAAIKSMKVGTDAMVSQSIKKKQLYL